MYSSTYERLGQEWIEDITILCRDCHELFERQKRLAKYGLRPHTAAPKNKTSEYPDISTGFYELDWLLGGFKASSLITIVGPPGVGKTSLLMNIALIAITNGIQTAFFGLQSSLRDLMTRLVSLQGDIDRHRLQHGPIYEEDLERVEIIIERLAQKEHLFIEADSIFTFAQLRQKCVDLCATNPINLLRNRSPPQ